MSEQPIGTVCPFAGQVNLVNGEPNTLWGNQPCSNTSAATPSLDPNSPLNHLERDGWMLCDGRSLLANTYPELYAVLGGLYGQSGIGTSLTFKIPDYRGLFLRGFDAGAGIDPDAATRTSPTGAGTSNVVGSLQCDAMQEHTHGYNLTQPAAISQQGQAAGTTSSTQQTSAPTSPARNTPETRPKNIAVNYIIKFR